MKRHISVLAGFPGCDCLRGVGANPDDPREFADTLVWPDINNPEPNVRDFQIYSKPDNGGAILDLNPFKVYDDSFLPQDWMAYANSGIISENQVQTLSVPTLTGTDKQADTKTSNTGEAAAEKKNWYIPAILTAAAVIFLFRK